MALLPERCQYCSTVLCVDDLHLTDCPSCGRPHNSSILGLKSRPREDAVAAACRLVERNSFMRVATPETEVFHKLHSWVNKCSPEDANYILSIILESDELPSRRR